MDLWVGTISDILHRLPAIAHATRKDTPRETEGHNEIKHEPKSQVQSPGSTHHLGFHARSPGGQHGGRKQWPALLSVQVCHVGPLCTLVDGGGDFSLRGGHVGATEGAVPFIACGGEGDEFVEVRSEGEGVGVSDVIDSARGEGCGKRHC